MTDRELVYTESCPTRPKCGARWKGVEPSLIEMNVASFHLLGRRPSDGLLEFEVLADPFVVGGFHGGAENAASVRAEDSLVLFQLIQVAANGERAHIEALRQFFHARSDCNACSWARICCCRCLGCMS